MAVLAIKKFDLKKISTILMLKLKTDYFKIKRVKMRIFSCFK